MPNLLGASSMLWEHGNTMGTSWEHDFSRYLSKKPTNVPMFPQVFSLLSKTVSSSSSDLEELVLTTKFLGPHRFSGNMGTRPLICDRYAEKPCSHRVPIVFPHGNIWEEES